MSMSSLERVIYKILVQENFSFEREKQFSDFRQGLYRYDFWIPSRKILLEVQGIHHYTQLKPFHNSRTDFLKAQERDRRKISYALARSYILYCIPYWEISNIHSSNDIFSERFHATSIFHNDLVWKDYQKSRELL